MQLWTLSSGSAVRRARMSKGIAFMSATGLGRPHSNAGGPARNSFRLAASVGLPLGAINDGSAGITDAAPSREQSKCRHNESHTLTQWQDRIAGGFRFAAASWLRRFAGQHIEIQLSSHFPSITGA